MNLAKILPEQGVPETIELVAGLIADDMATDPGVVQIYNQKRRLPPVKGFFVDVALLGTKPFAVKRGYENDPASADLREVASCNVQEMIQVDIFSFDASARLRKFDVLFALTSIAAEQLAERWAFKTSRLPASLVDASEQEGSAILNRFALTFTVIRAYGRIKAAPTFSVFQNPPQELLVNP